MKKNKIKLITFILFLILIFIIFLCLLFKPYDYQKEYGINKFKIIETYDKKNNNYVFHIDHDDLTYPYIINNKYIRKKELIKDIKVFNSENEICILPISEEFEFYPLCSSEENIYTHNLSSLEDIDYEYEKLSNIDKIYNEIEINKIGDLSFLIYNYKGFYLINKESFKEIILFKKDNYSLNLVYQKDNYIIIPDYNQSHYFNKFYIIDIFDGKVKEIETKIDISFESIFIGDYKNSIYLLDKKEEKEYEINLKKKKVEEIEYQIIEDNKLVKTSFQNILNKNIDSNNIDKYKIINNNLYLIVDNIEIKVSNKDVTKIIKIDNENVYYLCNEYLYMYNNKNGEILLLSNFEWNFNNTNVIYLYK